MTYNESFSNEDKLQSLLQKFGKSIDTKKLLEVLEPYKDKSWLYEHYVKQIQHEEME